MQFLKQWLMVLISVLLVSITPTAIAESDCGNDMLMDLVRDTSCTEATKLAPLLTNIYARDGISLNGKWHTFLDEAGYGFSSMFIKQGLYSTKYIPDNPSMKLQEVSFDDSNQLTVPGDWNSQSAELDRYRGSVWYYKELDLEPNENEKYYLHFGGANYVTDVLINDINVGKHTGGYTSFNYDVTDHLQAGKNSILIQVNGYLDNSTIPTITTSDFWKYGGLIRDVQLITVPKNHISQYHVYLADHEKKEVKGWVQLEGDVDSIELTIPEANVKLTTKADENGRVDFSFTSDLSLWSPDSPKLYDITISAGEDNLKDRIGFRTIETQGEQILLNGEPVKLYGVAMHAETPLRKGMANTRKDAEVQLGLIKELGGNFVRLAHYPHDEYTVKVADELGLMVWSEIPIVSSIDWENPKTLETGISQVTDNTYRDLNRASIVMWSIANETFPQSEPRYNFLAKLAETVRSIDESNRPIAAALLGNFNKEFGEITLKLAEKYKDDSRIDPEVREKLKGILKESAHTSDPTELTINLDDPLGEIVDIVGYNEYFGWYYSAFFAPQLQIEEKLIREAIFEIMPDIRFKNIYGKPMIISEFGAGAVHGRRDKNATIWSEEYQAKVYQAQLNMLEKSDSIQGMSPWVLKDFRSYFRQLNGIQDTYNRKGIVSETGKKKLAYSVLQDYYQSKTGSANQ